MLRVGLTGTVGAGKSEVGRRFEDWGAYRTDADRLARRAVAPGTPGLHAVREALGDGVLDAEGGLDRAATRRLVFGDPEARARLESIVHAEVRKLRAAERAAAAAAGAPVLVEEVPLLFEAGLAEEYDEIVVVDAPVQIRRARTVQARGWTAEEFDAIDGSQWPGERKREAADHVIVNDGSLEDLHRAARVVWERLESRRADEGRH